MVEQRKSLPQAVPSSIYSGGKSGIGQLEMLPSGENRSLLLWVEEAGQCRRLLTASPFRSRIVPSVGIFYELTLVPP